MSINQPLDKVYDPRAVEPEMFKLWESSGAFRSKPANTPHEKTFCIVIPPPNVTGALHLGHALNNTLQDILVRYHRMRGFNTLWQPGTDHAGIATQAVVEKRIRETEGKTRHDIGREELVNRIWKWKDEYEARIVSQLKLMGCSCDWDRLRFTLDDGLSKAVRLQFFNLFKDGLIFRGKRLVNWDTQLQTAVSDDEVYHEAVKGHFWHIKYPVIDPKPGEPEFVIIATTRPETMLGDVAVAVHHDPESELRKREVEARATIEKSTGKDRAEAEAELTKIAERRESHLPLLIKLRDMAKDGRKLRLPLAGRVIPLITDEWANPMLGSGCVKITPAHDANDYQVQQRHPTLGMINVLSPDGKVAPVMEPDGSKNSNTTPYEGLAFNKDARAKVVADLEARELIHSIEDREIELAHSDRSKVPIEPYLSDQWFLKMADIDEPQRHQGTKEQGHDELNRDRKGAALDATGAETKGVRLGDGSIAPGLAQAAMDVVTKGRVQMYPPRYSKTYLDWLGEKRDWCISRQLWWGHRIPVWATSLVKYFADVVVHSNKDRWIQEGRIAQHPPSLCIRHEEDIELVNTLEKQGFSQDPDVLDTWFSSALWPFSTLGWPEKTEHLQQYYPGSVLVTSRDIITLWVVRMVMFGLYATGKVPFDRVFITPKVLDGRGETMSKSKGNGVDPVDIIHIYGADALRYGMADMTTETQDIRMPVEYLCPHCGGMTDQGSALKTEEQARKSRGQKLDRKLNPADCHRVRCMNKECGKEFATQWADKSLQEELGRGREVSDRFEVGRNFCNKLWNAARFAFMNLEGVKCERIEVKQLPPEDRWILARLSQTVRRMHELIDTYQYSAIVKELRDFFWDSLCDWYIELTKPRMNVSGDGTVSASAAQSTAWAKQVLAFCIDQVLRLWHPIIPFITERLWQQLNDVAPQRGLPPVAHLTTNSALVSAEFPPVGGYSSFDDAEILTLFSKIQDVVRGVRELRDRCNVSPKQEVVVTVALPEADRAQFTAHAHIVKAMAGVEQLTIDPTAKRPKNAGAVTIGSLRVFVHDIIDDASEHKRTTIALEDIEKQIAGKESKLSNEKFVANAKPEVVTAERERLDEMLKQRTALREHLSQLS